MNIKLMRNVDELFGPPVCLILHTYNAFKKPFVKVRLLPVNKILVIKFFGMGSILLMGPAIRALRDKYPSAKITIFTFQNNREICELTDMFDEIISLKTGSILNIIWDTFRKLLYLRRQRFDVCIDMEFFSKFSTIIAYLTKSRVRVGYFLIQIGTIIKMMWRGNLLTHQVYYNQHKHVTESFLALTRAIGADTIQRSYAQLHITQDSRDVVNEMLRYVLKDGEYLIAVNINTSNLCLERKWPAENFRLLIKKLTSGAPNLKIALIGGREDVTYVQSFIDSSKGIIEDGKMIDLSGKLSMAQLCALLEKSRFFITNDSGPLHMAVSLGRPTVSFFGPETPQRFGPRDDAHLIFYCEDVYCTPCLNVYNQKIALCNGDNVCMRSIKVDDVYNSMKIKFAFLSNG